MRLVTSKSAAWLIGAAVYLGATIVWGGYDGPLSLFFLPLCAAIASAVVVVLALLLGWAFRPTPMARWWRAYMTGAVAVALGGAVLLLFGSSVGLTAEYTHPETGQRFAALHPAAALGG